MGQTDGSANVLSARQRLEAHPHFSHHCETICIEWIDNRLVLSGQLPSFYLRQLAQEALHGLAVPVINQIEVVCCGGLSSAPPATQPEQSLPRKPR